MSRSRCPLQDRIPDDIGIEELAGVLIPCGSFRKIKAVRDLVERRMPADHFLQLRRCHVEFEQDEFLPYVVLRPGIGAKCYRGC